MNPVARPLAATLALQSLTSMAMIAPSVMAPVVALELGLPPERLGWFVAIEYFVAMLSGLACGGLITRHGAMRVCQISVCLAAAGLAAATAGAVPMLFASAALIGAGYGLVNPVSSHILIKSTPARMRSLIFSIKQTGVPLGGALAGVLCPPLILLVGWRFGLAAAALPCLLVVLAFQSLRSGEAAEPAASGAGEARRFWAPIGYVLTHRPVLEMALASLFFGFAQLALVAYFVSYLKLELGYTLVAAGLIYACAHLAGVAGRIVWGAIADRFVSPRRTLGLLGVTMGISCIVAAAINTQWPLAAVVALSIVFGATAVGWNGIYLAEVARLAPTGQAGIVTGGTQFFTFLGAWSAPPLFGLVVAYAGGYANGFLTASVLPLIAGVYLLVRPRQV